jgi:hypothetical protein
MFSPGSAPGFKASPHRTPARDQPTPVTLYRRPKGQRTNLARFRWSIGDAPPQELTSAGALDPRLPGLAKELKELRQGDLLSEGDRKRLHDVLGKKQILMARGSHSMSIGTAALSSRPRRRRSSPTSSITGNPAAASSTACLCVKAGLAWAALPSSLTEDSRRPPLVLDSVPYGLFRVIAQRGCRGSGGDGGELAAVVPGRPAGSQA